ncbi:GNAT family N-acetyltransferase [Hymenobacter tibetensis]|uniref:GNAT family N-acetyltransferase n=1 Tax=Hymenobacter tibetensis TaxID=497967 RepID=A0ABY4CZ38_9BACT|nr:GNAT family N-acetyltransferase [Hymenobacter tibetensis]UOG75529.1 GNAT family N-acetyltransferase [Hymenobacter tibetensis]
MPLRLLRHSELDLAAWDACVEQAQQVVPYAQSWWLQATAGRWDALVEIEAGTGRYLSVVPLPVKWRPWGREVHQPPFTQQLGVLTVAGSTVESAMQHLLALPTRYAHFYTQLNDQTEFPAAALPLSCHLRHTYHLPLDRSYAVLRAGYFTDNRRRLRQNSEAAVPLVVAATQEIDSMMKLFRQTKGAAAGLRWYHYTMLRQLVAAGQQRGEAMELLEVRAPDTGELLAGAFFVRFRTKLVYLFAAASPAGKKAGAPVLLLDHAIQRHANTPELVLDFEGSMIPSIARFFANFGAKPVAYAALSFTQRPWYLQWTR